MIKVCGEGSVAEIGEDGTSSFPSSSCRLRSSTWGRSDKEEREEREERVEQVERSGCNMQEHNGKQCGSQQKERALVILVHCITHTL